MARFRNYIENNTAVNTAAREKAMQNFIASIGYEVREIGENIFEVVKSSTYPIGDYLSPISWEDGMHVTAGYWYTDGENIWEATKDGTPTLWEDSEYFDVIR